MHSLFITALALLITACNSADINNQLHNDLIFSNVRSNFKLTDNNNYGCEEINISSLNHILLTGTKVTEINLHDYYDTTGCSIKGKLKISNIATNFTFDYGGIFYFSNGTILGCGKLCCKDNFTYCSWDEHGLKGE